MLTLNKGANQLKVFQFCYCNCKRKVSFCSLPYMYERSSCGRSSILTEVSFTEEELCRLLPAVDCGAAAAAAAPEWRKQRTLGGAAFPQPGEETQTAARSGRKGLSRPLSDLRAPPPQREATSSR